MKGKTASKSGQHRLQQSRKRQFLSLIKKYLKWLSVVFVCFSLAYGVIWCIDPSHFPITTVKIVGNRHYVSTQALQTTTMPFLQDGFFRLKVSALQQQLLAVPWLKQVDVRKVWPNQLVVHFEEHEPGAFWSEKAGNKGVISREGILFYPDLKSLKELSLPKLEGPQDKSALVWQQLQQMEAIVAPLKLKITDLSLVARGAWQLRLSNGITVILGRNEELNRLGRFVRVYEHNLAEKQQQIASVDMRYTSGMAIGWRTS